MRVIKLIAAVLSVAAIVAVVACGGGDDGGPTATEESTGTAGAPAAIRVEASDDGVMNVYDVQPAPGEAGRIEAPANAEFEVTLVNVGVNPHDIDFYDDEGGSLLSDDANGEIIVSGEEETFTFTTPGPGTYYFFCSVHPTEMFGEFVVQ
jgi:plastocyanin